MCATIVNDIEVMKFNMHHATFIGVLKNNLCTYYFTLFNILNGNKKGLAIITNMHYSRSLFSSDLI